MKSAQNYTLYTTYLLHLKRLRGRWKNPYLKTLTAMAGPRTKAGPMKKASASDISYAYPPNFGGAGWVLKQATWELCLRMNAPTSAQRRYNYLTFRFRKIHTRYQPFNYKARRGAPQARVVAPIGAYKSPMLLINKSYLVPLALPYSWTYTMPEHVTGAFVRLFLGVFLQRGNVLNLLKILSQCAKDMSLEKASFKSQYQLSYPSFTMYPEVELPTSLSPFCTGSTRRATVKAGSLKLRAASKLKLATVTSRRLTRLKRSRPPKARALKVIKNFCALKPTIVRRFKSSLKPIARLKPTAFFRRRRPLNVKLLPRQGQKPTQWLALLRTPQPPRVSPSQRLLFWNLLYQQPTLTYSLKYCRLSRRVRKILKNKYRYAKYFFMIAPYKRRLFTLHLWKYVLKFHDERTFLLKLNGLFKNFTAPDNDSLLWSLFYIQQRLTLKKLLGR